MECLEEGLAAAEAARVEIPQVNLLSHLALVTAETGDLRSAADYATEAIELVESRGWAPLPQVATAYLTLSMVNLQRTTSRKHRSWWRRAGRRRSRSPPPVWRSVWHRYALTRPWAGSTRRAHGCCSCGTRSRPGSHRPSSRAGGRWQRRRSSWPPATRLPQRRGSVRHRQGTSVRPGTGLPRPGSAGHGRPPRS